MRLAEWMYLYHEWRTFVWAARGAYHAMLKDGAKSAAMIEFAEVMRRYHDRRRKHLEEYLWVTAVKNIAP